MARPPIALLLVWGFGLLFVISAAVSHVRGGSDAAGRGLNAAFLLIAAVPFLLSLVVWVLAGSASPGRWLAGVIGVVPFAFLAWFPISAELARRHEAKLATGDEYFQDATSRAVLDALRRNDRAALARLASGGANLDAAGSGDMTLLTWAIFYAPNAVAPLLDAGAKPNHRTPDGEHPLQQAVMRDASVVTSMLAAGADANAKDRNGDPFAFHTLKMQSGPKLRAFVDAGTDVKARDAQGWTLLMRCVQARLWPEAAMLLEKGADPNAVATDYEKTSIRDVVALVMSVDSTILENRSYVAFAAALDAHASNGRAGPR
jgi:hypothetical protein